MLLRDLTDVGGWIKRILHRLDRLEGGAPLENASVTGGRLRFIGGTLRVDSGGTVEIVGTLEIDGTTTVTGTFTVEGPWSIDGDGNITGNVTISGEVTLTGDFTVDSSGRIHVGGMTLDPSTNGGTISFSGGKSIHAASSALGMYFGSASVVLNTAANLIGPGCSFVAAATPRISGLPTIPRASANNAVVGTVWADTTGELHRVVT